MTVIGQGELGHFVSEALLGVGFSVYGYAKRPKNFVYPCYTEVSDLWKILNRSDYVLLTLPHTKETTHFVDANFLTHMRSDSMLINVGRGALVDEDALLEDLGQSPKKRALLDVFKSEPLLTDHPFWRHSQITITPHIAAATRPQSALEVVIENLHRLAVGQPFLYEVNKDLGY